MRRTDLTLGFIAGIAVSLLFGAVGFGFLQNRVIKFERAAAEAQALAAKADSAAQAWQAVAFARIPQIDSLTAENRALEARLARRDAQLAAAKQQLASLDAKVKADSACWELCRPSIEARDSLLADAEGALADVRRQLVATTDTLVTVRGDLLTASTTIDDLRGAIAKYEDAVSKAPTRSSFWTRLKPDVGIGVWAGRSLLRPENDVGYGFTLSWELF